METIENMENMENMEIINNLFNKKDPCYFPLCKEYSKFLLSSSWLMSITIIISYLMEDWNTLFFELMLLFTSVNYWRDASYGFRRNIDMFVVIITSCYFIIESVKRQPVTNLVIICFYFICSVAFYFMETILYYFKNPKWIVLHMSMHIYFIAMVIYYYSHIYMINYEERYKWLNFATLLFDCIPY